MLNTMTFMTIGWRALYELIERSQVSRHFISYNLDNFRFSQKTFYRDILKKNLSKKAKKNRFFLPQKADFLNSTIMICIIRKKDLISTINAELNSM